MPVGAGYSSISNELYYYTDEVAGCLTGSPDPKVQWEIKSALEAYFSAPENKRKRNGFPASGSSLAKVGHYWVACQELGIPITPRLEEAVEDARWRAEVEELPEIERYLQKEAKKQAPVAPKVRKVREVSGDKATAYIQDAIESLGPTVTTEEVRKYLLELVGVHGSPFFKFARVEGKNYPVFMRYSKEHGGEIEYILTGDLLHDRVSRARKAVATKKPRAVSP